MNYMGFTGWSSIVDRLYPGNDLVDWISYDPYAHSNETTFDRAPQPPAVERGLAGLLRVGDREGAGQADHAVRVGLRPRGRTRRRRTSS